MGMNFYHLYPFLNEIEIEGDILEIGSLRGDGSTYVLGHIAKEYGKTLYSVDASQSVIDNAKKEFSNLPFKLPVEFFHQQGEYFIDDHPDLRFSIVLLDNFDWRWSSDESEAERYNKQSQFYKDVLNVEMNNLNSQVVHLHQMVKLVPLLTKNSIVICDDTFWAKDFGSYSGKGGAVVPYLMSLGFSHYARDCGVICLKR